MGLGLLCHVKGHHRDGARVWFDGAQFRAPCARCGLPLIRDAETTRWRPFDLQRDADTARQGRPTSKG